MYVIIGIYSKAIRGQKAKLHAILQYNIYNIHIKILHNKYISISKYNKRHIKGLENPIKLHKKDTVPAVSRGVRAH